MAPPFRAWPYAALAVVQFEWKPNVLTLWVVFRHTMDQTVKPPHAKWLIVIDGVNKLPTASGWVDAYTLLLSRPYLLGLPTSVTLAYDGPDEDLRTTWQKQWEPWGAIVATSFQLIPTGLITMWHGAVVNIPPGWVLCDGNNGTPNLLGLSVIGAGGAFNPDDTGGDTSHHHDFTGDGHIHSLSLFPFGMIHPPGDGHYEVNSTAVTGTTNNETTRSPYYALCFIMKT